MYCIFVYESTHNEGQKKSGGGMVEYWTNGGTIKKNRQKYTHIPLLTQDRDIYDGRVKIHMHTYISMQTWTDIKNKFEREQGFVIGVGIMNKIRQALTHSHTTSNTCNMCMHKNTLWTHTHNAYEGQLWLIYPYIVYILTSWGCLHCKYIYRKTTPYGVPNFLSRYGLKRRVHMAIKRGCEKYHR